jgi:hypothetical protein
MYGTIIFKTIEELAEFLSAFGNSNSTCSFDVSQHMNGNWHLNFDGGK